MTTEHLLRWFRRQARDLPWRSESRDPYLVLVSEFMLQQTQVDRVVPMFEAFVARFPGFGALAAADEDDVVAAWSGLGYYRRARMLHRLAREVAARPGGLPTTARELVELPGIGPYTAAAVASMAFDEASPVLDGNVMRVGARVLMMTGDPRSAAGSKRLASWVAGLMEEGGPPGAVNEALMELGARVCSPQNPDCERCPLAAGCGARAAGRPEDYPPARRRRATVDVRWVAACAVDPEGRWLLRRIEDGPILRGLWLPPLGPPADTGDAAEGARQLVDEIAAGAPVIAPLVRHTITHRKIDIVPVRFEAERGQQQSEGWRWIDPRDPGVPTSSLLAKLVASVESLDRDP